MKITQHLLLTSITLALITSTHSAIAIDYAAKCSSAASCQYDISTYHSHHSSSSLTNMTESDCIANYETYCWRPDMGKCEQYTDNGYFPNQSNALCPSLCENMGYNVYVYDIYTAEFGCACLPTPNGGWQDIGNGREQYYTYTYKTGHCKTKSGQTATSQYRCKSGYYGTASSGCTECPDNATCAGGTGTTTIVCKMKYYKNGTECTACPDSTHGLGALVSSKKGAHADTLDNGATSITECYIDGLATYSETLFYDSTGTFYLTDECYYNN